MGLSRGRIGSIAAGLLAVGLFAVPTASASTAKGLPITHRPLLRTTTASLNWSGYFERGATGAFHAVTARWVVPHVKATTGDTFSASWVGIDGVFNADLIQTGTEADFVGGAAQYHAWWEILPAAATPVFSVRPGDVMTASVSKVSGATWTISITDTTSGRSFTANKSYSGPATSAEWIQERPSVNGALANLAHFGTVTFDPLTVNGNNPAFTSARRIVMVNNAATRKLSNPSVPDADTDGFNVAFGSQVPPKPPAS